MSWQAEQTAWPKFKQKLLSGERFSARTAVLAAHPDDESIGASVLLSRSADARVIYLTDGAPRERSLWPRYLQCSREEYANLRRVEAERALAVAGVPPERIHWLGAIDQEAIVDAAGLAKSLAKILREWQPELLVTHSYEGGHPDHDTCALIASIAVEHLESSVQPERIEMTSYHAGDGGCVTGEFLNAHSEAEITVQLGNGERVLKQNMMAAHNSQRLVLQSFGVEQERYRLAPKYDFESAPHEGRLWYECLDWETTGERWRGLAREAIAQATEPVCR